MIYATQQGRDIVKINGRIPKQTSDVHGITKNMTLDKRPIKEHIDEFIYYCDQATTLVGHNIGFDIIETIVSDHTDVNRPKWLSIVARKKTKK